ncbi:hypothetical protein CDAR_69261 [Caerostris darwini]|uniref:Maturase K n=1 Tax=Caerostris darwini TaxID=1538125 RepID=A0AAV4U0N5_9ARAC|nr:hypothetical protein CDAR_69261 [Caerostris darwini]
MDYSNTWHVVTEAETLEMAWHKKTPFGSRGHLFRIQTLKEFASPVYLFYLSCRVAVELLFKKKKRWFGDIIMDLVAVSFEVSEFWREAR